MAGSFFTLPTLTLTSDESIGIYTGFAAITQEERLGVVALLISRLKERHYSTLALVESVLAIFCAAVPEMATHLSSMRSLTVVPRLVTQPMIDAFLAGEVGNVGVLTNFYATNAPDQDALEVNQIDGVYAGVSSILMSIGRQCGHGPEAAAVKSRPAALISRFMIDEPNQGLLPGRKYGPSQVSMEQIFSTFSNYTEPRMKIVQFFLAVGNSHSHIPQHLEIIMTNFRLMRGAQMTHVGAITKFTKMHPWVLRVPELIPLFQNFADEMEKFHAVPHQVREYHRLLVPQSEFLFLSSDYKPLTAVAGAYIAEVDENFASYEANVAKYTDLIDKVRSYAPNESVYFGASALAAQLGVPDVPLPAIRNATQAAPAPMV